MTYTVNNKLNQTKTDENKNENLQANFACCMYVSRLILVILSAGDIRAYINSRSARLKQSGKDEEDHVGEKEKV